MTGQVFAMYVIAVSSAFAVFQGIVCMSFKLKIVDCIVIPVATLTSSFLSIFWYYAACKMISSSHPFVNHVPAVSSAGVGMYDPSIGSGLHPVYGVVAIGMIVLYYVAESKVRKMLHK